MTMQLFEYIEPREWKLPILISVPHAGLLIPDEIRAVINARYVEPTPDCDFFVDHLYRRFASEIGVGLIKASCSRYVVDLNRNQAPLYHDGRVITGIVPEQTFAGEPLYDAPISDEERARRVALYYDPYHRELTRLLNVIHARFGVACLLDAHSIKRSVPTINAARFPDLILGTNDGVTCPPTLQEVAIATLESGRYELAVNSPFRGGAITRGFADLERRRYTLQLEMSQDLYMNEADNTRTLDLEAELSAHLKRYVVAVGEAALSV